MIEELLAEDGHLDLVRLSSDLKFSRERNDD